MLGLTVLMLVMVLAGCGESAEEENGGIEVKEEKTSKLDVAEIKERTEKEQEDKKEDEDGKKEKKIEADQKENAEGKIEPIKEGKETQKKEKTEEVKKNTSKKDTETTSKADGKKNEEKKTEKKEARGPQVSSASGTYYVTAPSLNVRSGDGTSYSALGSIPLNHEVNVTGKTSNGWYQFDYDGKQGYVSGNYLSDKKVATTKPKESNTGGNNKKDSAKQEKPKGNTNNNVVDDMKNLGNSQQVILVTTKGSSTSSGQVRTYEKDSNGKWNQVLQATAYIGKNGFSSNKVEGDGKSPTGKYTIGSAFGYQGNPGTKLNFKSSTSNDVWVDDSNSKYYNTWQKNDSANKDWNSAEDMTHRLYNYGFVINYNTAQTPGKGSAIFMHVGNSYTLGCTAMNQSNLISIMQWIDPAKSPVVIQTPESGLGNY